jgi:hypothetical protein
MVSAKAGTAKKRKIKDRKSNFLGIEIPAFCPPSKEQLKLYSFY